MATIAGRDVELAALAGVLGELRAGRGRTVLIEGEAGIGKSTLVAAALERDGSDGIRVLSGTCDELTQQFPLSVVTRAMGLGEDPAEQSGREPGVAVADPVQAALEELLGRVHEACAHGPLVVVLEDLHWADGGSIAWWRRLCRVTPQLPLVLIGTRRPVPRAPRAQALGREVREGGGIVLPLSGLAPSAVTAMAKDLVGGVPGPRLLRWLKHTSGNPFYIREMIDEASRSGALKTSNAIVDLACANEDSCTSGGLAVDSESPRADVVESRLDFLPQDAVRVLRIAALLGPEFSVSDLATMCGQTPTALLPTLEDSFAAGVLEDSGAYLRFRHGLLRQALYEGMPGPVRAGLHRQAAQTLTGLDAPAERVARQLMALPEANSGEDWEVGWLAAKAERLATRLPTVAAVLLERALRKGWPDDAQRALLEDNLLSTLFHLGRYEQTERLAKSMLPRTGDPDRCGHVTWLMAYALMRARRYADAEAELAAAAERADLTAVWRARLTALRAMMARYNGTPEQRKRYAVQALAAGRELNDVTAIGYALHAQSHSLSEDDDDLINSCRVNDEARAVIEREPRLGDLRLMLTYNRVGRAAELGNYEEASRIAREALARDEMSGSWRLRRIHGMAAAVAYELGRWDEALAELDASMDDEDDEAESPYIWVLIAGHRDEWPKAEGYLAALRRSTAGFSPPAWYKPPSVATNIASVALLDIERAGTPEAAASMLTCWLDAPHADRLLPFLQRVLPSFARQCLTAGCRAEACAAADAAGREAERQPRDRERATARWCSGMVDGDAEAVSAAARSLREIALPLHAGNAFEDAAVLLAERRDLTGARIALGTALELYAQLSAAWDARRAMARVRPLGVRPGVRGPRRRPSSGWASLTATERQIAELVAARRSNPEIAAQLFISRRTVESHVSHILAKLQVASRWEVRAPNAQVVPN